MFFLILSKLQDLSGKPYLVFFKTSVQHACVVNRGEMVVLMLFSVHTSILEHVLNCKVAHKPRFYMICNISGPEQSRVGLAACSR